MRKTTISLVHGLTKYLNRLSSWLDRNYESNGAQAKFVDLAPTDEADKAGVYSEALFFATNNPKVLNIALTGPYGSGKSSIIQSFLKNYRRQALHISLAAFIPEASADGVKVGRQEIERSILQQMLYGADANKLPLSRFKRIQSPSVFSITKSLFITTGTIALWYVFDRRAEIISGTLINPSAPSSGFNIAVCLFAALFFWMALHHFYVASFGLSLKSISLKDVEIKPAHDDQTSILNRHLDEILYFFQSTSYDLVIIEDLDRFNDAEIFVTLREINSLVNGNEGIKQTIRFLYALRDDMFINTDRTKFFEFIIPVIPIINTSNSIDMVLAQGRRLALDDRLDRQFLREVSRHLNDLRLIQSIFNEYAIYISNLENDGDNLLNANKLLAILIYKNVYPRDFEQLHRGGGNFAKIMSHQDDLIKDAETKCRVEIEELEKRLDIAERQVPSDLVELRKIYAMALIEKLPAGATHIGIDYGSLIPISMLATNEELEKFIALPRLCYSTSHQGATRIDISQFQTEVDPRKSYKQRKEEIEIKITDNKSKVLSRINDLRLEISKIRMAKLNELLRLNSDKINELFKDFEDEGELARFLILEGHLDDTYYQYTSLFHSGRLSPNDNKFLIQIRAFITPEPDFPIDNPKEVTAAMRDEDFRQSYVLNIKIVDSLLAEQHIYPDQIQKLFQLLSSNFESCQDFFNAYYASGLHVSKLLLGLADAWNNFLPTAIASSNNITHITQIISNLSVGSLKKLASEFAELSDFVGKHLPEILLQSPELAPERLEFLDFNVQDLATIKEHFEIVRFIFQEGRYELTIANLEYVYQDILGQRDIQSMRTRNFTTVRSTNNVALIKRVERDFNCYLKNIILPLEENSEEDISAILQILGQDEIDQGAIELFLERQKARLPDLEGVPEKLHATLFQLNAIEATWMNCLDFISSSGFDKDSLIAYLELDSVRSAILCHPMPSEPESFELREFLIKAGSLSNAAYGEYVHALPTAFEKLPEELEPIKLQTLISEEKITFNKENFDALAANKELQILFIAINIKEYLADPTILTLDDEFLEALLRSDIDDPAKIGIVKLMNLESLEGLSERSALVGPIINKAEFHLSNLSVGATQSLIINSRPIAIQISLFNKYQNLLSPDEIRHVLENLPHPFSEIKKGYAKPKLKNNPENRHLVQWLKSKGIISSWSEDNYFDRDIRVNLFRS
ncbi:DNA-binding protein [Paracidovorax avenae]|uniref:YobI family P-loop NTPase n=1 Tax=Paracidovorax avenae TaxID=80867 RepID=UPI000D21F874|nr:P-loop NTPase fold protein [Paracidovorax avenae]AVS91706.1 DNA-binding protein [Paracidovorax avenae]AVT07808.1 DNA-binding protein [Paracidovorax avenae]